VCFEFFQGGGDTGGALGEAVGEGLDVDGGALAHRLDVGRQPDGEELRILELRYGTIRAQAPSPGESLARIEQLLGET
jgi:hypothetical protein